MNKIIKITGKEYYKVPRGPIHNDTARATVCTGCVFDAISNNECRHPDVGKVSCLVDEVDYIFTEIPLKDKLDRL